MPGFLNSAGLPMLVLVPLLGAYVALRMREKRRRCNLIGAPLRSSRAPIIIVSLFIGLLTSALARPYLGKREIELPSQGRDILVLVDVSMSMLTRDVSPTRLEFTKRKLIDLVDYLSRYRAGDRLGLVVFAAESYLFCPPTTDYRVLKTYINALSTDIIGSGGSNINAAVTRAIESLSSTDSLHVGDSNQPLLLLFSDGEDSSLRIDQTISLLRSKSLPLYALGVGTPEGKSIEVRTGKYVRDRSGSVVISKLNEESLRALSEKSGGTYGRATLDDSDLQAILNANSGAERTNAGVQKVTVYHEWGPFLLIGALALVLVLFALSHQSLLFASLLFGLIYSVSPQGALADEEPPSPFESYQAYQNGDYERALRGFEAAHESNPSNQDLLQALASTAYKLKQYARAEALFAQLAQNAQSGRHRFEALYNQGNAELMQQHLEGAIQHFEEALAIKPEDEATQHNLELAKDLLRSLPTPTPTPTPTPVASSAPSSSGTSSLSTGGSSSQAPSSAPSSASNSQGNSQDFQGGQSSSDSKGGEAGSKSEEGDQDQDKEKEKNEGRDEDKEREDGAQQSSSAGEVPQHDPQALKEEQAKDWLESLPDSPLLYYKNRPRSRSDSSQEW